jgi:hypothetical protein
MQFAAPVVRGLPAGSQPLLNWKLYAFAEHRRESDPKDLLNDTDPAPPVPDIPKYPGLHQEAAPRWAALSAKARAGDPDLVVPAAERARYSRTAFTSRSAASTSRTIPRTRDASSALVITTPWATSVTIPR